MPLQGTPLVQYYLDEASSGSVPTNVTDAADTPSTMSITYGTNSRWTETGGNRGVEWTSSEGTGYIILDSVTGEKVQTHLDAKKTGTLEIVMDVHAGTANNVRITYIGSGGASNYFGLSYDQNDNLYFYGGDVGETLWGQWDISAPTGRKCYHCVFDSANASEASRMALYEDGVYKATEAGSVAQNSEINIPDGDAWVIGNRDDAARSLDGIIYYVSMYSTALTPAQASNNATVLLADDDTPSAGGETVEKTLSDTFTFTDQNERDGIFTR